MRGEVCILTGSIFSIVSLALQIALHVSQASPQAGSDISMVNVNLQDMRASMQAVWGSSRIGADLYNDTFGAPLASENGLRHEYRWGLYSYCGYILTPTIYGTCSNTSFPVSWTPFETIRADVPPKYFVQVNEFIIQPLRDSPYLGTLSRIAFYLVLLATIMTILVIPLGAIKTTFTFLLAAMLSCIATAALLVASSMWTAVVLHGQATNMTRTGVYVYYGRGVWLLWTSFVMSLFSILPYVVSSRTYRRF